MLKSNLTNVKNPVWNLMMKNIYQIPGAYKGKTKRFQYLYTDPSPLNYITEAKDANAVPFPSTNS
jgi:cell surface protein SprA